MNNLQPTLRRAPWMILILTAAALLLAPSRAHAQVTVAGYNIGVCTVNGTDWANDVEEFVCVNANYDGSAEIDAYAEVDSWAQSDWQNWPNGDPYLVDIGTGIGISGLADSGTQNGSGYAEVYSNSPQLGTQYFVDGSYSECYDYTGNFGANSCTWICPFDSNVWIQATINQPIYPTIRLTNSPANPGSQSNLEYFYYQIDNGGGPPMTGGVELSDYDAVTGSLNGTYNGVRNGNTFVFSYYMTAGTHQISAWYVGDNPNLGYQANKEAWSVPTMITVY